MVSERQKRKCEHGAILKVVTTNICGSDQHMVRGRTSLPGGHMVSTNTPPNTHLGPVLLGPVQLGPHAPLQGPLCPTA